jgi:hypothetical protein
MWNCRNNVIFNNAGQHQIFAGYAQGYLLDPHVVPSPTRGSTAIYGYCMYSVDGGRLGYLQPGWLAAY